MCEKLHWTLLRNSRDTVSVEVYLLPDTHFTAAEVRQMLKASQSPVVQRIVTMLADDHGKVRRSALQVTVALSQYSEDQDP
jgi:hypothetical protein